MDGQVIYPDLAEINDFLKTYSLDIWELFHRGYKLIRKKPVYFERAIFSSWFCSTPGCAYCFMTTQAGKASKYKSRRNIISILAEALLCRKFGWKIEFLTDGSGAHNSKEFRDIAAAVSYVYGQKIDINAGIMKKDLLEDLTGFVSGITGAVDCYNPKKHRYLCPGKPIDAIKRFLDTGVDLGYKVNLTVLLGIGESLQDFHYITDWITNYPVNKVVVYSLTPHRGTRFENATPPPLIYQAVNVSLLKNLYPDTTVVGGIWDDRVNYAGLLLSTGADNITKLPMNKFFGSYKAMILEKEIKSTGRQLISTFTDINGINNETKVEKNEKKESPEVEKRIINLVESKWHLIEEKVKDYIRGYMKNYTSPTSTG